MFEKFSNIIEGKFAGPLEKLSNQRHLRAIRDGIIATLPIIIVSSLLMVVAFSYNQMPESWALQTLERLLSVMQASSGHVNIDNLG